MIKRSLLYLRRKYKRSVLLFLLLFVISFSLAIGVTVWNSIGAVTKEVQNKLGTSFNFRLPSAVTNNEAYYEDVTDSEGNLIKSYIGPKLNDDIIRTILEQVDGISDYNAQIDKYVYVDNANLIPGLFALGADSTNSYDNLKILYERAGHNALWQYGK